MEKAEPRLDLVDIMLIGSVAVFFDILSIIPGVGSLGDGLIRFIFWMKGLNTALINVFFGISAIAEAIPAISILPTCTAYVVAAVLIDRAQTAAANGQASESETSGQAPQEQEAEEEMKEAA